MGNELSTKSFNIVIQSHDAPGEDSIATQSNDPTETWSHLCRRIIEKEDLSRLLHLLVRIYPGRRLAAYKLRYDNGYATIVKPIWHADGINSKVPMEDAFVDVNVSLRPSGTMNDVSVSTSFAPHETILSSLGEGGCEETTFVELHCEKFSFEEEGRRPFPAVKALTRVLFCSEHEECPGRIDEYRLEEASDGEWASLPERCINLSREGDQTEEIEEEAATIVTSEEVPAGDACAKNKSGGSETSVTSERQTADAAKKNKNASDQSASSSSSEDEEVPAGEADDKNKGGGSPNSVTSERQAANAAKKNKNASDQSANSCSEDESTSQPMKGAIENGGKKEAAKRIYEVVPGKKKPPATGVGSKSTAEKTGTKRKMAAPTKASGAAEKSDKDENIVSSKKSKVDAHRSTKETEIKEVSKAGSKEKSNGAKSNKQKSKEENNSSKKQTRKEDAADEHESKKEHSGPEPTKQKSKQKSQSSKKQLPVEEDADDEPTKQKGNQKSQKSGATKKLPAGEKLGTGDETNENGNKKPPRPKPAKKRGVSIPTGEADRHIPSEPAPDLPEGWTQRKIPRPKDPTHRDTRYYSPRSDIRFRMKSEAKAFLKILEDADGDEEVAFSLWKNKGKATKAAVSMGKKPTASDGNNAGGNGKDDMLSWNKHFKKDEEVLNGKQKRKRPDASNATETIEEGHAAKKKSKLTESKNGDVNKEVDDDREGKMQEKDGTKKGPRIKKVTRVIKNNDENDQKKKGKVSSPGKPKRPPNAWIFYCKDARQKFVKKYPDMKPTEIKTKMGEAYKSLSQEEKEPYEEKVAEAKRKYKAEMELYEKTSA